MSLSVRLARVPGLRRLVVLLGGSHSPRSKFIEYCRTHRIEYANASKRIPLRDNSVEVLYSSHMIEHLDRVEAQQFLREALRVLQPGGILRLAFPDIRLQVDRYLEHGDADRFIEDSHMTCKIPRSFRERVRSLVVGMRHHLWMYDGQSLSKLLTDHGFVDAAALKCGETKISNPAPLDLCERAEQSGYVEATKPI